MLRGCFWWVFSVAAFTVAPSAPFSICQASCMEVREAGCGKFTIIFRTIADRVGVVPRDPTERARVLTEDRAADPPFFILQHMAWVDGNSFSVVFTENAQFLLLGFFGSSFPFFECQHFENHRVGFWLNGNGRVSPKFYLVAIEFVQFDVPSVMSEVLQRVPPNNVQGVIGCKNPVTARTDTRATRKVGTKKFAITAVVVMERWRTSHEVCEIRDQILVPCYVTETQIILEWFVGVLGTQLCSVLSHRAFRVSLSHWSVTFKSRIGAELYSNCQ